ncbi:transcriptional regulator [Microbacterium sp. Root61]|uniref:ArsR/SmtB family transcription factor n=1 Tax=Microbacterium sp. Root61 TaxID=1736570 RepID=UPI0006F2FE6E|nr:helix-turn-helix domain-containing protein [Microbacterium sp. Root61]KRA23275.1 transcriptional regulator [Microbacterium sp. Root61]
MSTDESVEHGAGHGEKDYRVLDAGALRALAHPLRVQIYDILSQYGPQTASSLAVRLGESSGSTSYHLRALAAHDLIEEVEGRGTGRERWWHRPVGGVSFANPDAMKTPSGRAATQLVMAEWFQRRQSYLMDYINRGINGEPEAWQEGSLISTATARMTPEQTQELVQRVQALLDEAVENYRNQEGENVRPVTMRADIFPLPAEGEAL